MRHLRHNFQSNYSNFSGNEKQELILDELAKVIILRPDLVASVLNESGVKTSGDNPVALAQKIEQNPENRNVHMGLARLVVLLNASDENGEIQSNIFASVDGRGEQRTGTTPTGGTSATSSGGGAKNFFKKFGQVLNQNSELITNVGMGIAAGVKSAKEAKQGNKGGNLTDMVNDYNKMNNPPQKQNKTLLYVGISLVALTFIVGAVILVRKNNAPAPATTA